MDTRTGEIKYLTPEEAARAQEALRQGLRPHRARLVPIPDADLHSLSEGNRHERRKWAAQRRREERRKLRESRQSPPEAGR